MIDFDNTTNLLERLDVEIQRTQGLTADLKRLRAGDFPSPAEIARMPMINGWRMGALMLPSIVGTITGHPEIGMTVNRTMSMTSDLWVLAPKYGFARTLSRFYALGSQIDDSQN